MRVKPIVLTGVLTAFLLNAAWSQTVGWRGDWTGRYPDATPPTTWYYRPISPVYGLRCQAQKPQPGDHGEKATAVWAGDVNEWLTLGAFNAKDARTALDESFLPDESKAAPAEGDKAGELSWKPLILRSYPDQVHDPDLQRKEKYGPYRLGWEARPVKIRGDGNNPVVYAHAYLYAESDGSACFILNHVDGMKAWVNGKEVYKETRTVLDHIHENGMYIHDRCVASFIVPTSAPRFNAELRKGWNRLLFKVAGKTGNCAFMLRVTATDDSKYETKNVKWVTQMPDWCISSPIVVKDRVFVTSEPDELLCVDKNTGKILWRRVNPVYDVIAAEEREKNPAAFKEMEPLVAELVKGVEKDRGTVLRGKMLALLQKTDPEKYFAPSYDGHFSTIGRACRTPVSDGRFVYAQFDPYAVVAYDLDGNRQWIQNITDLGHARRSKGYEKLGNNGWVYNNQPSNSPVLIGDKLVILNGWLKALDKKTGKVVWDTGIIDKGFQASEGGYPAITCAQSLVPGRVGDLDFVMGFFGRIVRASDGKILTGPTNTPASHTTPVIDGDIAYVWGGQRYKLSAEGDGVKMQPIGGTSEADHAMSSPLVHEGLVYYLDCIGDLRVFDAQTNKQVYKQTLEMTPLLHHSSMGATASVCLAGKYIFLMDDQGACVVIEPGRTFKPVAVNRIDCMMQHPWPISTIERVWSTPTFDGKHMYIRGERNLYCIGEKGQ